ncbi:MFS transporter, MCP family, solute carrier family 16, member 6 [Hypoxylon sp. FL1284]|nr:MFS transporter, MCP family, solute carrier family 16, member 6 [Hypoxylon sp. FL1284]
MPPDGGYGWVCVVAQFLLNGFTWGVAASYGVYLAHYLSHDLFPEARSLDYAFIGGFNFAFALLVAPLATMLTRVYGVRALMSLGVVLLPAGFVAASFAIRIWHLYLSQGLCVGLGIGLLYVPATAVIPQWFSKKRSLANGICSAGSGIGGLIICFSTQAMLNNLGLFWALGTTAIIVFVVNLLATLLMRSRNAEIRPDQRIFIMMFGYITLMFSLSDYAQDIGHSKEDLATVPALLNLGAAIGRPIIGYTSDRYGRVEVAGVLTFSCGMLVFCLWMSSTVYGMLLLFALIAGAILGIFWAVIGPLATDIVGLKELPAFSLTWLSVVVPSAVAEVIALDLRRPEMGERGYLYPQIFAGVSYLVASVFLLELWRSTRRKRKSET